MVYLLSYSSNIAALSPSWFFLFTFPMCWDDTWAGLGKGSCVIKALKDLHYYHYCLNFCSSFWMISFVFVDVLGCETSIQALDAYIVVSGGHDPGWAYSVLVPFRSKFGRLRFWFRFQAVWGGSLAVQEAFLTVPTPVLGRPNHRFHSYFFFKYDIKIL